MVHVTDGTNDLEPFASRRDDDKIINIAAAEARKAEREVSFQASCAKKGIDNVICAVRIPNTISITN